MKYVAFIDSLGFKNRITKISHEKAKTVIMDFNQEIYNLWRKLGYNNDNSINGRTFSDSLIIHTVDDSKEQLEKIITFLTKLYRISIIKCDLPLRGGIAVGEFDDLPATEFNNLQKGLLIGNAFIDAYLLESSYNIKGSKIIFKQDINLQIERKLNNFTTQKLKKTENGETLYELKWSDLVFLSERNYESLNKFIDLATSSKWVDHYFGTLETFLIRETSDNKQDIFIKIIERLKQKFKYTDLDNFIENFLKSESATYLKRSFLAFLRNKI